MSFQKLWKNTIWGRKCAFPISGYTWYTVWGRAFDPKFGGFSRLNAKRKPKPRLQRWGGSFFATIWGSMGPGRKKQKRHKREDHGPELLAKTIWGRLPLWDGRFCSYYPGNEPYEH